MKNLKAAFLLIILLLAFFACKKVDKPSAGRTIIDSVSSGPSGPRGVAKVYPYIDTFIGVLSISFQGGLPQSSTDTAFKFYVRHADENTIEFISSKPIQLQNGEAMITIDDTMVVNGANKYYASTYLGNVGIVKNLYEQDAFLFLLSNGKLFVDWNFWLPIIATCDEGENSGHFAGTPQ